MKIENKFNASFNNQRITVCKLKYILMNEYFFNEWNKMNKLKSLLLNEASAKNALAKEAKFVNNSL